MRIGVGTDFYYPWIGGPSAAISSLAHGLALRGHEVFILAPSPTGRPGVEVDGAVEITRTTTVRAPFGYNLRAALPPRGVRSWLDRVRPDVVNIHHPFPLSAATLLAARRRGVPVVATNHTIPSCSLWGIRSLGPVYDVAHESLARWITWLLRASDVVATPTATAARLTQELGFRGPIHVISNGIDTRRFSPGTASDALRGQLGLHSGPVVLYTGRLDAEKEMDTWLAAAARVAASTDVRLVIGGEGADRERLQRRAAELGLAGRAKFIGYVSHGDLPDLYRLADIYFITSPVELQSISTLEAAASGLPVVAVDAAALPELVTDGRNGYLVEQGDAEAAADALTRLLSDSALRARMGDASRAVALTHAHERSVEAYERLLIGTIAARRGVHTGDPAGFPGG